MNGNGNIKKTISASELNRPNSEGFKVLQYAGETVVRAVDSDGNALAFSGGSGSKPKIYKALLTQVGSADPTVTVLENELSADIVWTRDAQGTYIGTLSGAFTVGKVFLIVGERYNNLGDMVYLYTDTVNSVSLETVDASNTATDDILEETAVSIEVYPA